MSRYVLRRLLQMVPLILGITLVTFGIINLVPGSPVSALEANLRGNSRVRQQEIERIKRSLGLDQPLHVRYFVWVGNVLRGDLGISLRNHNPVTRQIAQKLPNTLLLMTSSFLISFLIAIPIGVYAATRRGGVFDNTSNAVAVAGYSIPAFWLALMLILLFAIKFKEWGLPSLPAGGATDVRGGGGLLDRLEHLILPCFTLAFVQIAYWTRFVRSQMLEVLGQDFVRTARAKGLREGLVVYRHALRNAVLPLVTLVGLTIPELFGGALLIEQIFTYPGMGQLAYAAAIDKDYPLVMGTVLIASVLVILGNLFADVAYALIDPRVQVVG